MLRPSFRRSLFSSSAFSSIFRYNNIFLFKPTFSSSSSITVSAFLDNSSSVPLQTPLFLRPPAHSATFTGICKWHHWAKTLASSIGSTFSASDYSFDSSNLLKELKWLVDDAIEDASSVLPQLQESCVRSDEGQIVNLKTPLEELYVLWKQRIEERRPFQYIVGCEYWRDLVLSVQEGVLIPRHETELIVDLVAYVVSKYQGLSGGLWVDLGTGSGAIAIGIARIIGEKGRVIATDLSPIAVAVGSFNVRKYGLQGTIEIRQGSWLEPLKNLEGKLSGLVCNPPYLPSNQIQDLEPEISKHEPRLALDGGVNGMDYLLHLPREVASMLKSGGFFCFETYGEEQSTFLLTHLKTESASEFYNTMIIPDLDGEQRFVCGFRR